MWKGKIINKNKQNFIFISCRNTRKEKQDAGKMEYECQLWLEWARKMLLRL
jgi:hypothetical protein